MPQLIAELQQQPVVYTSRFLNRELARKANMGLVKTWGNKLFSATYNLIFKQQTTDLYTGCKGLRASTIADMEFQQKGFEHVLELAVKLSLRGYKIHDMPVLFQARSKGSSKMSYLADSARYFILLARYSWLAWRGTLRA